jgi:hypothetical protein
MLDDVYKTKYRADVLILGDFNIDMLKPHSSWDSTLALFGLVQLVTSSTRTTPTSSSLIDHIYTNNPKAIINTIVLDLSISDHNPISCTRSIKLPKPEPVGHTHISFRSFKHFNQNAFFADLNCTPFATVFQYNDPNQALSAWYKLFIDVVNKHAPIRHKRVKHPKLPPWLNKDIIQAMSHRDKLKTDKMFTEYKQARNKVKNLVRNAKKAYFSKLTENNTDISSVWRALNAFTKGTRSKQTDIPRHFTADAFNNYFLSIAEKLAKSHDSADSNGHYSCPELLIDFCQQKTHGHNSFTIPLIAVHEVGKYITKMDNKKSSGPDELSNQLIKLSMPYIVESLTYIFNLCIEQNIFPSEFKRAKVIPLPKTRDHKTMNEYRPISLLPVLSKLLERHVHTHLVTYLEQRELFHPLQSGFRGKHSCSTAFSR